MLQAITGVGPGLLQSPNDSRAHSGSAALAASGPGADLATSMGAFHDAYLVAASFAFIGIFTSLVRGHDQPEGKPRLPGRPG